MHIWLINPFDELPGEGPEQRYACLARHLSAKGHDVLWVSSDWHHRKKTRRAMEALPESGHVPKGEPEEKNGVRTHGPSRATGTIRLVPTPMYHANISLRRLRSHAVWAKRLERELTADVSAGRLGKPDLILAASPPLEGARAALQLARRFEAVSVIDFMDDWPDTWLQALPKGKVCQALGKFLLAPWLRLARRNMQLADRVCAQSHAFAQRARSLGHRGEVHVCYLGETPLPPAPPLSRNHPFHILYLGAMGKIYDLETVLRSAQMARDAGRDWQWTFAGTDPGHFWQKRAKSLALEHVTAFPGYVSGPALAQVLRSADLGLIPMDPRSGVAVPYKAGNYLAAGLPVLSSLPGELADLLAGHQAGEGYLHGNPNDLFEKLQRHADDPRHGLRAKQAAKTLFEDKFNRDIIYPQWADWIASPAQG